MSRAFIYISLVTVQFIHSFAFSQAANATLKLDANKPIRIEYQSSAWNANPNASDSAWMLFRDAGSGRLARIEMQETGANTNLFSGSYQISFRQDADILPEVYFVPKKMMQDPDSIRKVDALIKDGTLLKKPFFLRQASQSLQVISVYDTREQALQAFQDYKNARPIVDRAALEAQARLAAANEALKAASAAAKQLMEREKLELEEKAKLEALKKKQAEMDQAEINRRKAEAKTLTQEAMALYKAEKYPEAELKFAKATELDPNNAAAYFPYGVTLYKNDKFNRSLVALSMAKSNEVNPDEREYFTALNHMKLKEYDSALKEFNTVKNGTDKTLSPSSSFFAGVIEFQKENYDVAKTHFEFTLDKSSDPRMDQQAEAYIEQIANIKMFQLQKSKKIILGFNWGVQYDSNILNQAAANAQTSLAGLRAVYGGSVEYRPIYSESHEFSSTLSFSDMYSWDTSLKPKTEFQKTDPLLVNLSFPYKYKGKAFGKAYQLGLTPGFEGTFMNVDDGKSGVGNREQIVSSSIIKADNTFVMSEDYFATYSTELRSDNSLISGADDDNQSATKITLSTSQTFFKDKKKTEASIYDGSFAYNLAKGKNQKFYRLDTGLSYMMPWISDTTINGRLGLFYTSYPENTESRADNGLLLSLGARKPINEKWASLLAISAAKNNSNISTSAYDKFSVLAGVTYTGAF